MNYQTVTRLRVFMFCGGAVFAADADVAIAFAVEHGLMDADANAQLSLDTQAARRALVARARAHEGGPRRGGERRPRVM